MMRLDTAFRALWELQAKAIYACLVAGKSAAFAEAKTRSLLAAASDILPFSHLLRLQETGQLEPALRAARTGRYSRMLSGLPALARLDVRTCSLDDLEAVPGIGPKTARFFLLWTRPEVRLAALDRHVLRWLRERGYRAPRQTPSSPSAYRKLERAFLAEADRMGKSPRDLDEEVWSLFARVPVPQQADHQLRLFTNTEAGGASPPLPLCPRNTRKDAK